jgi:hypothetical protein
VDKNHLEEITILSNAFYIFAKSLSLKTKGNDKLPLPDKNFLYDLQEVLGGLYPKYANGSKIDHLVEIKNFANVYLPKKTITEIPVSQMTGDKLCELWAFILFAFLENETNNDNNPHFYAMIEAIFSIPAGCTNLTLYVGYERNLKDFAEKNTYYSSNVFPEARKCKNIVNVGDEWYKKGSDLFYSQVEKFCDAENGLTKKQKTEIVGEMYEDFCMAYDDNFCEELETIMLHNGYDIFSEISKSDIVLAMQTREMFGTYNGDGDNENFNKFYADIVVSVLSKKYRDLLLKTNTSSSNNQFLGDNKKMLELEKEVETLKKNNGVLNDKLNQVSNKDNKKDARISDLEKKNKDLKDDLAMKEAEIASLYQQIEHLKPKTEDSETKEDTTNYVDKLSQYSMENKVVMIGGNPNLLSKLKPIFTEITFVPDKEQNRITDELIKNATIVLYKTDSLGHSAWQAATSRCKRFGIADAFVGNIANVDALSKNICEAIENTLSIAI